MAYNPRPEVRAAENIGKKFGKDMVLLMLIDSQTETIEYVSWGKTPKLCAQAEEIMDTVYEEME